MFGIALWLTVGYLAHKYRWLQKCAQIVEEATSERKDEN